MICSPWLLLFRCVLTSFHLSLCSSVYNLAQSTKIDPREPECAVVVYMDLLWDASDESPDWLSSFYSLMPMKWFHNRRMCDKRSSFLISFHFFRVSKLYDSSSVKTLRHVRTVFSFFGPHDLCRLLRFSVHGFSIFWHKYSPALK